ncbi:site-specific integrase [Candidatus Daviesbacteria bacterium]|nr:site-specific integrase [Candidatus Daviesbacteria bacterium]
MTVSILIDDFLQFLETEKQASQLTIRNYDHYLKRFLEFSHDIEPKDIDLHLIRKYKLHLAKQPLKKVTQNYFLIALRSFLRYLADQKIDSLSFDKIELLAQEPRDLKVLDELELQRLLEAPDPSKKADLRDRAIMETLYSKGLRVSELTLLNRDSIKLNSAVLEKYLQARKDSFKPLFIRFQGKKDPANEGEAMRLTPRSIERVVEKYVKRAALSVKATPEILRRTRDFHSAEE